jgi:hypothetical protein
MTRPELPPGWRISARYTDTKPLLCRLGQQGWVVELCADHAAAIQHAWQTWNAENPEWAAYLAQLEAPKVPRSAERVIAARSALRAELGYPPSLQAIGDRVGMTGDGVRLVLKALSEPTSYVAERRAVKTGAQP